MQPFWIACVFFSVVNVGHGQKLLGSIEVSNVGLMNIYEHSGGSGRGRYSVLASTYDTRINTFDMAYVLQYPGQDIDSNFTNIRPRGIYNALYWGKEIEQVDSAYFR